MSEHECLECGARVRTQGLTPHLRTHKMTLEEYKEKYGLDKNLNPIEEEPEQEPEPEPETEEDTTSEEPDIPPMKVNNITNYTGTPMVAVFSEDVKEVVAMGEVQFGNDNPIPTVFIVANDGGLIPPFIVEGLVGVMTLEELREEIGGAEEETSEHYEEPPQEEEITDNGRLNRLKKGRDKKASNKPANESDVDKLERLINKR